MERRALGKSGLTVTQLGLGLAALGRPGYINLGHAQDLRENYDVKAMEQNAHNVLDAAWASGIRYFDTARSYGLAEQFLSSWLSARNIAPDKMTIGSKWGYTYTAGWKIEAELHEIKDHSLQVLQRQLIESRELLGSNLDLYQIHSATLGSKVLQNQEVLSKLAQHRADGLHIGLSLSGPGQTDTLRKAIEIRFDGDMLFSVVQATWNLLCQEAGEALWEAREAGMGIIIKEVLANGRLTLRNQDLAFKSKLTLLETIAANLGTTIDAIALGAVLTQPWTNVALSGAATIQHLRSNISAIDIDLAGTIDQLLHEMREAPAEYWAKRSLLNWN